MPPKCFLANTSPYLVPSRGTLADQAYLLGVLSSIPLDWYARRFVETHVNFFVFNPFPVPRPPIKDPARRRVIDIAARLATPDDRFEEWASHYKLEPKVLDAEEKNDLITELDAAVSLLYGLARKNVAHIFETFHEGWDQEERLKLVLAPLRRLGEVV